MNLLNQLPTIPQNPVEYQALKIYNWIMVAHSLNKNEIQVTGAVFPEIIDVLKQKGYQIELKPNYMTDLPKFYSDYTPNLTCIYWNLPDIDMNIMKQEMKQFNAKIFPASEEHLSLYYQHFDIKDIQAYKNSDNEYCYLLNILQEKKPSIDF